jgi:hypothetical protein
MSLGGLISRKHMPDVTLPENAGAGYTILSSLSQFAGDAAAMVPGAMAGGAAGMVAGGMAGAAGGPVGAGVGAIGGGAIGAAAGAWAAPAALRTAYIQHLQKGDIRDFGDFWERASAVTLEALKAGTVGALTEGAGGIVAGKLAPGVAAKAIAPLTASAAKISAQVATMTTVGKAMEGQLPKADDFLNGALAVAALHGVTHISQVPQFGRDITTRLQNIYAQTGMKPSDVVIESVRDPVLKQELLSEGTHVPPSLAPLIEDPQKGQVDSIGAQPKLIPAATLPPEFTQPYGVYNPEFTKVDDYHVLVPHETSGAGAPPEPPVGKNEGSTSPMSPEEAGNVIGSRIGETPQSKRPLTLDEIRFQTIDQLDPVKKVVRAMAGDEPLPAKADPESLFRAAQASPAKANYFIDKSPLDFHTLEPTGGQSLKAILEPHAKELDDLERYLVAKQSLIHEANGIKTGVPLEASREFVAANEAKYQKTFDALVEYRNETAKYLLDSEAISKETFDNITSEEGGIPFYRVFESEGTKTGKGGKPVKNIKGSDRQIVRPLESLVRDTFQRVRIAEENRAKIALVDLARESGSDLIREVKAEKGGASSKELKEYLRSNQLGDDKQSEQIYRMHAKQLEPGQISVFKDGERKVYEVPEMLARAVNADPYKPIALVKFASLWAKATRIGFTENPLFLAKHFGRAEILAPLLSENGHIPFYSGVKAIGTMFKDPAAWERFQISGGSMSTLLSLDRDYIQSKIYETGKSTGFVDKITNAIRNPIDSLQAMADVVMHPMHKASEAVLNAPKFAEFLAAEKAGKDIFEAGKDARNAGVDYSRRGASATIKAISTMSAFQNVHLQTMDQLAEAAKKDPAKIAAYGSMIAGVSVMLWMANHKDERFSGLTREDRDTNWHIFTPTAIYRFPKPFEPGIVFGSSVERMLDHYYDHNPRAFDNFPETVAATFGLNPIPNAVNPVLEQLANRSLFSGAPIIPHKLAEVAPQYRYNANTSEAAKGIAKLFGYLPQIGPHDTPLQAAPVIDNYIRQWGGTTGQMILQTVEKLAGKMGADIPVKPTWTLSDNPFVRSFIVKNPSLNNQEIRDFYDNYSHSTEVTKTIEHLKSQGNGPELMKYVSDPQVREYLGRMQGAEQILGQHNKALQTIYNSKQLSSDEKRQFIDTITYQMIQVAKAANAAARQARGIGQ